MLDVKIFLKSGQVVEFVTKENLRRTKNTMTDKISELSWENVEGEDILFTIDLSEISAITYKERE